ncbi:RNA-binding protein [Pseudidiomarina indica]|uniref:RNA-binding protein n=1 Tax=Pseudidiomarina indica TaxID=1159017 RepID=A0A1G6DM08_9GAMM|nr:ribosome assembly RNA-binding protein YhbY [Pseudidiomarina indica]SDB46203.1 RNA-binding protein [Pseudidiomarina indica]
MATAVTLSNKQKQYLKGLAHPLKPVVLLGANGLTEGVMAEIELALTHHELIKIKVPEEERELREQIYATILAHTEATKVQVVGKVLTLYRPSPAAKIQLPRR